MSSPAAPFHAAQTAAIEASNALRTAMGGKLRRFTSPPTNATPPYVVNGADQVILDVSGCAGEGEIFATVSWWTREEPPAATQARAIGAVLVDLLLGPLTLIGHTVDEWELISESYSTDPDRSTHGVLVIRYLTTEVVA